MKDIQVKSNELSVAMVHQSLKIQQIKLPQFFQE